MRLFTVRFEDGTESNTTGPRNWYAANMDDTPSEDIAEKFMTIGTMHPRELAHGRMMTPAEHEALRESCEVIGVREMGR